MLRESLATVVGVEVDGLEMNLDVLRDWRRILYVLISLTSGSLELVELAA